MSHAIKSRVDGILSPTSSRGVALAPSPDRYRFGFVAWPQWTARPVRHPPSIHSPPKVRRGAVLPGLCGKCTHTRSQVAMTLVAITRAGRGTRVRVLYEVPRG